MAKNVTIQRIVGVLLHRIKFIILATVVMGLLFFMYSRFVIAPMYSTSTMIYVQNYSSSQRANANADTKVRHLQRLPMIQPKRQPMRKTRRYILLIFPPLQILLKSALHSLKIPMR